MVREITELFANVPDGVVLDATLGGAGHTTALLNAHPGLRVLGLDRDPAALEASRARLAPYGDRAMLQHRRFDDLDAAMSEAGIDELSGAYLISASHHINSIVVNGDFRIVMTLRSICGWTQPNLRPRPTL
jgi:16S rRNA C1402 N4-methylase RsmH